MGHPIRPGHHCRAHNQLGYPCGQRGTARSGYKHCYHHGGAEGSGGDGGDGRPIVHALYSRHVPKDWQLDYEYFKSDPSILSLQSDIAVARVARARFLKQCEGAALTAELADTILEHGIKIGKLIEIHNKVQYGERTIISEDKLANWIVRIADVVGLAIDDTGLDPGVADVLRLRIAEGLRALTEGK